MHTTAHLLPLHADEVVSLALASSTVHPFHCKSCARNRYTYSAQLICILGSAVFFLASECEPQMHMIA